MVPRERLWLAHTDADSTVPPSWLANQLKLANLGVAAVAGIVKVDSFRDHPAVVRRRFELCYAGPSDEHPHVHGANLGVRGELGGEEGAGHLMRERNRAGFGWTKWSTVFYEALGLFHDHRVRYGPASGGALWPIGLITPGVKRTGKRRTGDPFAPSEVAGTGELAARAEAGNGGARLREAYGVPRQSSTLR